LSLQNLEEDLGVWVPNTVVSCFVLVSPGYASALLG
jgi:hypothetical protein